MCAIAGVFRLNTQDATLDKMLDTMRRRGPDAAGICRLEDGYLLHARLAVIDPAGGSQPMTLSYGGEEYTIVRQGDILAIVE